jgi:uncharacterized protein YbaA (DUF1428 family)
MSYVDGFIVPVKKSKLDDYKQMATLGRDVWREHGALDYRELVADDVSVGTLTSFPRSVQLEDDEIVIFAYIVYKDRAHRDAVNAKVMADPRMQEPPGGMPFDPKRMIFGGFAALVE